MHSHHKKSPFRYILLFLFIFIIGFGITHCTGCQKDSDIIPENIAELNKENAAAQFQAFTQTLLKKELSGNTINLHYMYVTPAAVGISDYAVTLGNYSCPSESDTQQLLTAYLELLHQIPYDSLSEENQITYDVLEWYFEHNLELCDYPYYDEPLNKTIGIQTQLPILLAEYKFREEKDIQEYLQLLSCLPAYLDEITKYEKEKSTKGLFMADFSADRVIESCEAFLNNRDSHYLITTFEERTSSIISDTTVKENYCAQNKELLQTNIFPAYEALIESIRALKGTGTNQSGLAHFEKGKDYYETFAQCKIGTDKSMDKIKQRVEQQLQADLTFLSELLTANEETFVSSQSLTLSSTDYTEILNTLQTKMAVDFPAITNCQFEVKTVSPDLQEILSPAFYLTPPLDTTSENTIYMNPAHTSDAIGLFTTLAHEGFPGHMYQNLYTSSHQTNPVRALFSFTGYSEGYGTYAELHSYNYLDFDEPVKELLATTNRLTLALYARLDIGIHYEGWSYQDTYEFLQKYGIADTDTTTEIFQTIVEQPANYLTYFAGYLEIMDLREKAMAKAKDNFSLLEFHHQLLSIGEAPFSVLEKYME